MAAKFCFTAMRMPDSGYVVQEGAFDLTGDPERDKTITVGPGMLLAEMAMMADTDYSMTATATTPSTVMRIPRSLFLKMLEGYPDAARRIRDHIAVRAEAIRTRPDAHLRHHGRQHARAITVSE